MDTAVFLAVLAAAAMHAGWNAVVKVGHDRILSIVLISLAATVVSGLALPFVAIPHAAAWPWLLGSAVLHTGYKLFLIRAYKAGDLGQVYPIARGTAPLLTATVSVLVLGESITPAGLLGIGVLTFGVGLMSLRGGGDLARLELPAVAFALGTSGFIAAYTITDGIGARAALSPHGYAAWLFLLDGLLMLAVLLARRGMSGLAALTRHWRGGLAGGAMSLGSYWIAIWAMTLAPIGVVAALRETSVLFAALISLVVLHEPPSAWRVAAASLIVTGVVLTRLA
jgi:drug/metabolite transporter (DMT)-like permease